MHYDPFKTLEQHLRQYDKRRIYLKCDLVTSTWPYKRDDEKWMLLKRCKHFFSVNERYDSQQIDGGSYYSIACLEAVLEIELLVQCETSPRNTSYTRTFQRFVFLMMSSKERNWEQSMQWCQHRGLSEPALAYTTISGSQNQIKTDSQVSSSLPRPLLLLAPNLEEREPVSTRKETGKRR